MLAMHVFLVALLIVILGQVEFAFAPCAKPVGHIGHFVGRDQDCTIVLVQTTCHQQPEDQIGLTKTKSKAARATRLRELQ